MDQGQKNTDSICFKLMTGNVLAIASGLSFFLLCMILPLVGPAGSRVEHAGKNKAVFIAVLLVTLALAAASTWSKLGRRKIEGGPLPWFSIGLGTVCIVTFIVLLMGGLAI